MTPEEEFVLAGLGLLRNEKGTLRSSASQQHKAGEYILKQWLPLVPWTVVQRKGAYRTIHKDGLTVKESLSGLTVTLGTSPSVSFKIHGRLIPVETEVLQKHGFTVTVENSAAMSEGGPGLGLPHVDTKDSISNNNPCVEQESSPPQPPLNKKKDKDTTMTVNLKSEATEAAFYVASNQATKMVRDPLAALLARNLGNDSEEFRAQVSRFLQTELGTAIVQGMLSFAVEAAPMDPKYKVPLARAMRVNALAGAGNELVEVVAGPLREVMSFYLKGLPEMNELPASSPSQTVQENENVQ